MGNLIISERIDNSVREFFYVMFRHQKKALWFFLGMMIIAALVTMLMPRTYKSEAKLLVRLGRENASMDPTATASGPVVQVEQRRENEIKSELEILRSRDLAEAVVDKIGPKVIAPRSFFSSIFGLFRKPNQTKRRDAAIKKVMGNWSISSDKDSNIIKISYQTYSPKVAHDVVATLIAAYLQKHLEVNRTPGSYNFFKDQKDKTGTELTDIEKRLAEAKNQAQLVSLDDRRRIIQDRANSAQQALEETNADYRISRAKIGTLKKQLGRMPATVVTSNTRGFPNAAADGMRQKIYELQIKLQELRSKYADKNFLVKETRRQIRSAEALLKKEVPTRAQVTKGLNAAYEQSKLALLAEQANNAGLETKKLALAATLANVKNDLKSFNKKEGQISQLQREKEILDKSYREYAKKMEQARIDSALETEKISNISVAQAATYPLGRATPRTGLNLALAFLLGTFGSIGMAYWYERTDLSLNRAEEMEGRLEVPLLTTIPFMKDMAQELPSEAQDILFVPESSGQRSLEDGVWERCYEILGHRVMAEEGDPSGPQVIGVISCNSGEGASTVAANLAECLANRSNERVLFVEANLVTPSAHTSFGISHTPGLTDVITQEGDFSTSIQSSNSSNLEIIPAGRSNLTVSQLADSQQYSGMLDIFKSEYSYVVIDLPPVFKSIAALRLARRTDGIILVVGAEGVSWKEALEAKNLLTQAKAKVIGAVLNKQHRYIPDWLDRAL